MSGLGRIALTIEALVCFGCLAVSLLVSAPFLLTYVPLLFSGLFMLVGPLLACYLGGILGLYGLYALLRKILNPHATVASPRTILLFAAAGLAAVAGLAAFTVALPGSSIIRSVLIATALPVVGTLHLLYMGRWYLAPGRFPAPHHGVPLQGHSVLKSLTHAGLLVAATGLLPLLLVFVLVQGFWLLADEDTLAQMRACPRPEAGVSAVARLELTAPPSDWADLRRSLALVSEREGYEFVDNSTSDPNAELLDARLCGPGAMASFYDMHFTFAADALLPGDPLHVYVYPRSLTSDAMGFARQLARALADERAQPVEARPFDPGARPIEQALHEPSER